MEMLPGCSMMMTRSRMDMDPWHQKHPYDSPASHQGVKIRFANEKRAHRASFMQTLAYCIPRLKETVCLREEDAHPARLRSSDTDSELHNSQGRYNHERPL